MSETLKVALCQMTSVDDVEKNLAQMEQLIASVPEKADPVRLFCFPENCLYLRVQEGEAIPSFDLTDPLFHRLAALAKSRRAFLHLGSVPLKKDGSVYNSSVEISDTGVVQSTYHKIHLFDIQLSGQKAIRESDVFSHGHDVSSFEVDGWRIGQSICYDLRFSELYSFYAQQMVDVILVPSSFLVKTGEAHWQVLLRARAIESQCYVIAAAQAGEHKGRSGGTRHTYGHSLIADPWGLVLTELDGQHSKAVVTKLSKMRIQQVREQIPMSQHRRISR